MINRPNESVIPPGRHGRVVLRDRGKDSSIKFTTEVRGLSHERMDARADVERDDVMAVGLAQAHRGGSDSQRRGSALGRLCADRYPRPLGDHCFEAGRRYEEIVRAFKLAIGLNVPSRGPGTNGSPLLSPEQADAQRELAIDRKKVADNVLIAVDKRMPWIMECLTYDDRDQPSRDEDIIVAALSALAELFGFAPRRAFASCD